MRRILRSRPRLIAAAVVVLIAFVLLPHRFLPVTRMLVAWDIGALTLLILEAIWFTRTPTTAIADVSEAQEDGEWTVFWITVVAVTASFGAIVVEFSATKDAAAGLRGPLVALVAATLILSWLLTHTFFALRYAHEYYDRVEGTDRLDGGLEFPGKDAPDYWDFFYFALVLGMTFQVSDVQITSRKLRRLATLHGLLSFLFNTVIIALTVNIGASLL